MLYYVYFSDGGSPKTGLSPTWAGLLTAQNGADKSGDAPAIAEVGGGWYNFDITFGIEPWDVIAEDLVGVIDGGQSLGAFDRYKPVVITLRGLGLARIAHKAAQSLLTGCVEIYTQDGQTKEMALNMESDAVAITRSPAAIEN